jgi:pyridoxine 4-dehydrogenase
MLDVLLTICQHGLMRMTWSDVPTPDEQAFEAIKAGVDTLPPGAKMVLNSGRCHNTRGMIQLD